MFNIYNPQQGTLIKRYKRFFADILTKEGKVITAHCPNTGKMTGLLQEGIPVIFSEISGKLGYQWQMAFLEGTWVGVNTMVPNKIFYDFFMDNYNKIFLSNTENINESLKKEFYLEKKTENPRHRYDYCFFGEINLNNLFLNGIPGNINYNKNLPTIIEIKNVHWRVNDIACFPDCLTSRGTSQMETLSQYIGKDFNVMLIYVVQRNDCLFVNTSNVDIKYQNIVSKLKGKGAMVFGISCDLDSSGVKYNKILSTVNSVK